MHSTLKRKGATSRKNYLSGTTLDGPVMNWGLTAQLTLLIKGKDKNGLETEAKKEDRNVNEPYPVEVRLLPDESARCPSEPLRPAEGSGCGCSRRTLRLRPSCGADAIVECWLHPALWAPCPAEVLCCKYCGICVRTAESFCCAESTMEVARDSLKPQRLGYRNRAVDLHCRTQRWTNFSEALEKWQSCEWELATIPPARHSTSTRNACRWHRPLMNELECRPDLLAMSMTH